MHVLGIDVGGSKTVCVLADDAGTVLATARTEGANLQGAGELALEQVLHSVMERVIAGRAIAPAAICLGIAGVDRDADESVVRGIMTRIARQARVLVVNDALIALEAAIGGETGIVVVSGTGSIAYGRSPSGEAARAGGWGHVLGDEGSGYWIARLALRAVVRQADGRGQPTALTPLLLAHFGAQRASDLIHKIYGERVGPRAIAAVAGHLQQACDEGDAAATAILNGAADELTSAARAVTDRLALADAPFTFVLAGGMFRALPWLRSRLEERLPSLAPRSRTMWLETEPALGAVRLAVAELHGGAVLPRYRSHTA